MSMQDFLSPPAPGFAPVLVPGARPIAAEHICVIDGSNMLHRAWAMGGSRQRADGLEVAAVDLFSKMMVKLMRRMHEGRRPPSHVVVFFDPPRAESWRREIFPGYKATRPPMDQKLADQIPLMKGMCEAMGIAWSVAPKHEADDMIAAYVEDVVAGNGRCSIVSTDKDLMQLVRPGVLQLSTVQQRPPLEPPGFSPRRKAARFFPVLVCRK